MSQQSSDYPTHSSGDLNGYPTFITSDSKSLWDSLSPERQQRYLRAVPYIEEEYPDEELTVGMIGTIVAFGG